MEDGVEMFVYVLLFYCIVFGVCSLSRGNKGVCSVGSFLARFMCANYSFFMLRIGNRVSVIVGVIA